MEPFSLPRNHSPLGLDSPSRLLRLLNPLDPDTTAHATALSSSNFSCCRRQSNRVPCPCTTLVPTDSPPLHVNSNFGLSLPLTLPLMSSCPSCLLLMQPITDRCCFIASIKTNTCSYYHFPSFPSGTPVSHYHVYPFSSPLILGLTLASTSSRAGSALSMTPTMHHRRSSIGCLPSCL